jgi:hypothetical protein
MSRRIRQALALQGIETPMLLEKIATNRAG